MTKSICIGFLFLLLNVVAYGQKNNSFPSELLFGINGGATFSKVNFLKYSRESVPQKMLQQYVGGVSARYISEKHWGLQLELNYSQRGWDETDSVPGFSYTRSLGYVELPLLTHLYFNTGKRGRIVFNLGPQLSLSLNDNVLNSNNLPTKNPTGNVTTKSIAPPQYYDVPIQRKFDWGICVGGGFEFRSGIGSFVLEGRYYYGLSDIYNNGKADFFATSSNQIVNVKLTYFYQK